jgi:hypothetical protein
MGEWMCQRGQHNTANWVVQNKAIKARGSLMIWLDKDMP